MEMQSRNGASGGLERATTLPGETSDRSGVSIPHVWVAFALCAWALVVFAAALIYAAVV